jgi:hypothetical protein
MSSTGRTPSQAALSNSENKGKKKAQYCDLEGQNDVTCDYELNGTRVVSERVRIPESSKQFNLVGKALCRKHYNKLIVNAKNKKPNTTTPCSHPKHEMYVSTAQSQTNENHLRQVPERITTFFKLPRDATMCRHCLYVTDQDPEYINSPDYLPPIGRTPKENIRRFQGRAYVLRGDVIYNRHRTEPPILYTISPILALQTFWNRISHKIRENNIVFTICFNDNYWTR